MTITDDLAEVRAALELADWTGFHKPNCDHGQPGACSCERAPWAALDRIERVLAPDGTDGHPCVRVEAYNNLRARLAEAERVLRDYEEALKEITRHSAFYAVRTARRALASREQERCPTCGSGDRARRFRRGGPDDVLPGWFTLFASGPECENDAWHLASREQEDRK